MLRCEVVVRTVRYQLERRVGCDRDEERGRGRRRGGKGVRRGEGKEK